MSSESWNVVGQMAPGGDEEQLIPKAYLYFHDTASTWLKAPSEPDYAKRLKVLYEALKDRLSLVVIDLEPEDDAQEIFQTLNALGTPLLPADLVKNYLFHRAEGEELDTEKLYQLHWKQFDDERSHWRKEVGQGRFKRPRLDWFLQHYLTLVVGEEAVTTQLFSSFRDYVRKGKRSTSEYLEEFESYARIYKSFEEFAKDTWAGSFFYRLGEMDTSTVFPLLLEVFKRHPSVEEEGGVRQVCQDLESFLVRRVVCQLTPKNYNRFFVDVIQKLQHEDDFSASAIRSLLLEQTVDTSRWPSDDEFRQAWITTPFYRRLYRRRVRMILEALDAAVQTDKTEKVAINEKLTIEHLMPQEWEQHWPLNDGVDAELRNSLIHVVGNLTLLTKKLNPSVSNGPWDAKRKAILKHSAIALNRYFHEALTWTEDDIARRTDGFLQLALKIWPRPQDDSSDGTFAKSDEIKSLTSKSLTPSLEQQLLKGSDQSRHAKLWAMVAEEFDKLNPPFSPTKNPQHNYFQIRIGNKSIHYEWYLRKTKSQLAAALHFESKSRDENLKWLGRIHEQADKIQAGIPERFRAQPWGQKWASASFEVPYLGEPDEQTAKRAAELMAELIQRTWPIVKSILDEKAVS
jgi:Protein of unknown function (DUF1524)/Protein of unknown function DUF262